MSTRPTPEDVLFENAFSWAKRSTCRRLAVGAIITNWEMTAIPGFGYNGNARGLPNTCDSDTPGACGCLHAEDNAMAKAPFHHGDLRMFCTHTPCVICAKRIINNPRMKQVNCAQEYRSSAGVELLLFVGVEVRIVVPGKGLVLWQLKDA